MKIRKEDYQVLKKAMEKTLKDNNTTIEKVLKHYVDNNIGKDHKKRAIWDIVHASNLTRFICDNLYKYCYDSHIETAIYKIANEI